MAIMKGESPTGGLLTLQLTDDGYVKTDVTDTGFKLIDKDGTNQLVIDSNGKIGVSSLPTITIANTGFKLLDTGGTNALSIDSSGHAQVDVQSLPSITIANTSFGVSSLPAITIGNTAFGVSSLPSGITISPAITVDTAAYTAGDCIGGKLTLTNAVGSSGGTGVWQDVCIIDDGEIEPAMDIIIFNSDPTAATLTDQAAAVFSTDVSKIIAHKRINSSDYATTLGGSSVANVSVNLGVQASGSANLYACLIDTSGNDFVAGTDLQVKFKFVRD
jgi:hypothetical protein